MSRVAGVLRRSHAIEATRLHLRMPWVVSGSILSRFGPSSMLEIHSKSRNGLTRREGRVDGVTVP